MQLLSVRALGKALFQTLKRFRAQRILAGWTGDRDGPRAVLGGSDGGVGRGYDTLMVCIFRRTRRGRRYAHMDRMMLADLGVVDK